MKALLGGIFAATVLCGVASAQSIGGHYRVEGKNPNGSTYSGTADITRTSENTCRIVWNVGSSSRGICMRNRNAFTAAYSLGPKLGLVIYQISSDGSMQGLWTIADQTGVGTEALIPIH
jgi:hypothetical protein